MAGLGSLLPSDRGSGHCPGSGGGGGGGGGVEQGEQGAFSVWLLLLEERVGVGALLIFSQVLREGHTACPAWETPQCRR